MPAPIIGNAFTLPFDTSASTYASPITVDGEALMQRLVDKGYIAFRLQWTGILDAQLAIEDDVTFICDAADELAAFCRETQDHFVHLGDGELQITSKLSDGIVSMLVDHTPHLDARFHRRYELTATLQGYCSAWYGLVGALMAMAH